MTARCLGLVRAIRSARPTEVNLMNSNPSDDLPGPGEPTRSAVRRPGGRRGLSVGRTRIGSWWVALVAAAVVLLLLLIFVLQNGRSVEVSFLWLSGNLPLGVALLLAGTAGVLIVAIPGSGRIIQLRRLARKQAVRQPADQGPPATDQPGGRPADPIDPTGGDAAAPSHPGGTGPDGK
jgi:uncharacterized integral membrane protein